MEIPDHECDECGGAQNRYFTINCLCDKCLEKMQQSAFEDGKKEIEDKK